MLSLILVFFVALEHLLFGYIEMFGSVQVQSKAFGFPEKELQNNTLQIALSNQGIYNVSFGLLVIAFIIFNLAANSLILSMIFVVIVGIYGGLTVTKKIWVIQVGPALLALLSLLLAL